MSELSQELYNVLQIRQLEQRVFTSFNISEWELMQRAGHAAFNVLNDHLPDTQRLCVVCGKGNNGGDGYVVARLAAEAGMQVTVYYLQDPTTLKGVSRQAAKACQDLGVTCIPYNNEVEFLDDVIIDAVLGIGIKGAVQGPAFNAIEAINASPGEVLSIDVPSGVNADTGYVEGVAVIADVTVTFIGLKQGLLTGFAPNYTGEIIVEDLRLPEALFKEVPITAYRLAVDDLIDILPMRDATAHKGRFGHVLVIGGDLGMAGAARMSAEAAQRVGAGVVTVATRPEHVAAIVASRPELMCLGIENAAQAQALIEKASVIAIGPGLSDSSWSKDLLNAVCQSNTPLVVDAGALTLLAEHPRARDDWILTPHPGEAARLLKCDTKAIQADRFAAINTLQERYQGVIILKGRGTLVQAPNSLVAVCDGGNPGMASGGMGDILTGICAGLVAQGLSLSEAAQLGVALHANAGDLAALGGARGMLASDLFPHIRCLVNPFEDSLDERDEDWLEERSQDRDNHH